MFRIREYIDSDLPTIWDLHTKALQDIGVFLGKGTFDDDLNNIKKVYFDNNGVFLVGELDGKIIAMGAFWKKTKTIAEVKRMRVYKQFQGKGYGKQILSELEKRALKMGYKKLYLTAATAQIGARHFYENYGFKNTGKIIKNLPTQSTYKENSICELIFEKDIK